VTLTKSAVPSGTPVYVGALTGFTSNDPAVSCLEKEPALKVWETSLDPSQYVVMAQDPVDCMTANFTFPVPSSGTGGGIGTGTGLGSSLTPAPGRPPG
jgi:hypothetical protein